LRAAALLGSVEGLMDDDERERLAFWRARDDVSEDELVARMNAAPDKRGALLVERAESMVRRAHENRRVTR